MRSFLQGHTPKDVKLEFIWHSYGKGASTNTHSQEYKAAEGALTTVYGCKPVPVPCGGSIPIVPEFKRIFDTEVLLLGFGLEEDNLHGPNETFRLSQFERGVQSIIQFMYNYAKQKSGQS